MKKLLFLALSLASLTIVKAQLPGGGLFRPFKVDISAGYAIPQGSGAKGGVLFAIEPKYAVIEQLSVGLRMEAAIMARGYSSGNSSSTTVSADVSANASYVATGDYYFTNNHAFRPFAGAGVGLFTLASASVKGSSSQGSSSSTVTTSAAVSKFGGLIRAGFEASHFRLGIEYNLIGNTDAYQTNGSTTTTVSTKNGYLGLKLGVCIGGGKR